MRYLFFLAMLLAWGAGKSQGSGFSFTYTGPTQILVGPTCEAPLNWGHPNTPTAHSNIPGGFIVSFTIYSISGGFQIGSMVPGGSTVTVFYQALDNFGNTALFGFTIDFVDLLPPVFDPFSLPNNITVSCTTNVPPPAMVEATDNCDNNNSDLTITLTVTNNAQLCTGGTITRRWVADDGLGNQSTFIQTITVLPDNTPPVITNNLQNGTSPCSTAMAQYTTWLNAQRAAFTATDNGCGILSLTDNAPAPAIITSFCGVIEVTFTATDKCNNVSTVIKTFTITNNVAPIITTPASGASGNCGQSNINQIFNTWISTHGGATATDDCSSIFWSTFPPAPSIHDTCDAAIPVMFIAGDGCGNSDTTTASFILMDDTAPTITVDPSTIVLSCSAAGLDSILMDWLVTSGHSMAHDLCTSDAELEKGYKIGDVELSLDEVLNAWQDSLTSGCKDNVFIGGIGINNVKAYLPLRFTYNDKCDNEAAKTGYFGITDNGRPVFDTLPSDTSYACSENSNWEDVFQAWYDSAGGSSYSDLCSQVFVHPGITADSAIQYLTAALDTACMQGVAVTIGFSLSDECGNNSLSTPLATFSLQDTTAPVLLTAAPDIMMPCSENVELQLQTWIDTLGGASAADGCGAFTWSFSWVDTSGTTLTGVPGVGPYPQIEGMDCAGGIEIVFIASDICQNSVSDTASFSVLDTLPPVILIAEDSIHLICQDTIPLNTPVVTDGCDSSPLISFSDSVSIDSCLGLPEFIVRTWTATDACGNSSSAQEWFFRIDSIPPTFELPSDTVAFCSVDTLSLINVSDNCDPSPVTSFEDVLSGPSCGQTLTRTWTVTDACGNVATAIQQFDLSDDSPPVILYSPGNFTYTCDTTSLDLQTTYEQWMDSVTIEDGCSDATYFIALRNSYTLDDTTTWPGTPVPDSIMLMCGSDMTIEADLVAYDECGNVIVDPISFSVVDTVGPVFIDCPGLITVEPDTSTCEATITLTSPAFEEICFPDNVIVQLTIDGGDTIVLDSTLSIDTVLSVGIYSMVWTASDCNGNTGTCTTSVEVLDENALTVICPPDTLLYTPSESCQLAMEIYTPQTITASCGTGVITWSGYVVGLAEPSSFDFDNAGDSVLVLFTAGIHQVYLIAQDSTGDRDTCFYILELRDTFPPGILCQNDTLLLPPSGLENIDLSTTNLLVSVTDACEIDTVKFDPPTVNCSSSGQDVNITITVYDVNGNSSTCQSVLTINTQTLLPLAESQLCDDTLRLFANLPPGPDGNYTFTWSGPNSFSSADENPLIPDADSTFSGVYQLTVQSGNGCVSTGEVEVVVEDLISPSVTVSEDTLCVGEEVTFTTQNYSGTVSYQWYQMVSTGDTLLGNTNEPAFTYIPSESGTYSVYAIVIQDTCSSDPGPTSEFTVVDVPIASIVAPSMILCITDTLFLLPSEVFDSLQYAWAGPNGYSSSIPNPPGIPANEVDSAAIYTLIVSNAFCSSSPDSVEINIQLPPATPVITGDSLTCEGGTITLQALPLQQNYEWLDPFGNSLLTDEGTLILSPATMSQSGGWSVISFQNGCPSDTSVAFNIQIDSALQIEIVAPAQVCEGDSILLTVNPSNPGDYSWSGPGGFISNEDSPTALALNGTYYVTLATETGCAAEDSIDVAVDILPVITSLFTDADSCVNGNNTITIWSETEPPFSSGYQYFWEGPADFVTQDSSIVIDSVSSTVNGLYTLVIINGQCISNQASFQLSVKDSPAAPVIIGNNVYCNGDSIILSIDSPFDGGMYAWISQDTNVVIVSPGTLIIPNATQGWSGVYHVSVTVDGCTSMSSQIGVQVKSGLTPPSILNAPLVCEGDSLILLSNAPSGSTSHWIASSGFESFEDQPVIYPVLPSDAGTYQVLYTLNGCTSPPSNPFEINVQPSVTAPLITADLTTVCIDSPTPIHVCIDTGTLSGGIYTWILNGVTIIGSPGPDSCIVLNGAPLQGGLNSITVIASVQGCPSDTGNAVIITGDEVPSQQADAGFDDEFCPGELIILDGSSPLPGTGLWTSSDDLVVFSDETNPNAEVIGLPSGIYGMTWTLSYASCINYSADSVLISVLFSPETLPDTFDVPFGQTAEFIVTTNDNISMGPYTLEIITNPSKGNALHAGNGIIRYTPNIGFVGTDMLTYRVCSTDCPEECSESIVFLRVGNEDDCFVPTLFTPNDDGINDELIIPCLETEKFPQNKIIIFNEWGAAVFDAAPYQNDWDGTIGNDPLPVGTYFYIMDFGDGRTPKRSFLVLER